MLKMYHIFLTGGTVKTSEKWATFCLNLQGSSFTAILFSDNSPKTESMVVVLLYLAHVEGSYHL
jgi:hypothetical protein